MLGRRRRPLLLLAVAGSAAAALLAPWRSTSGTFVEPSAGAVPASPERTREVSRRVVLPWGAAAAAGLIGSSPRHGESGVTKAWGTNMGDEDTIHLGGVEWEDIKVGKGATPKVGQLIAIDFTVKCTVREREITVEDTKGTAKDYRWGVGQLLAGIDEGIKGMRTGGERRMRIPGNLAFGNRAVPAAVGRPAVPANTPVEAVVKLVFIPGADDVYELEQDPFDTAKKM